MKQYFDIVRAVVGENIMMCLMRFAIKKQSNMLSEMHQCPLSYQCVNIFFIYKSKIRNNETYAIVIYSSAKIESISNVAIAIEYGRSGVADVLRR